MSRPHFTVRRRATLAVLGSLALAAGLTKEASAQTPAPTPPAATPPAPAKPPAEIKPAPAPAAPAPVAPPPRSPIDEAPGKPPASGPTAPSTEPTNPVSEPAGPPGPSEPESSGSGLFESSQGDAAVEDSSSGASSAPTSTGVDLNGYIRGDVFIGKVPYVPHGEFKAAYSELSLKLRAKKEKYGDAFADARVRYGLQADTRGAVVDLREAYVNLYAGPLDLRLGQQIVVWGRADALNPTSNITPVDLRIHSPVEDDRRLGNVGARAFLNFSPLRLEGVWMPLYSPSELPTIILPVGVNWDPPKFPAPEVQNGLEAARVHLELPAIELSLSYLYGYAPLPGLGYSRLTSPSMEQSMVGINDPAVWISRTAYEQHVVGFDFATTLADWLGVRGEVAYRRPLHFRERVYAPNPDVQYVLGLDHTFGDVSIIAQYLGRYTVNWKKQFGPGREVNIPLELQNVDQNDPDPVVFQLIDAVLEQKNQMLFNQLKQLQHLASLRIEWLTLHQTLSFSALGLVNVSTKEWLFFPKIGYQLSDNLSTTIGAEIYEGPHDTLFGLIDSRLSSGYAELKMAF